MTEFGAVAYPKMATFHGKDCTKESLLAFEEWIMKQNSESRPTFVSDNPAFDWQWINYYFWKHLGRSPFGHSARRIGDYYAGLVGDFTRHSEWKRLRITKHDHNPVHDALGNAEAFRRMQAGERA